MVEAGFRPFRPLAVVGLGLIGGSFALDVKRLGLAQKILGYDQNPDHCEKALELGLVDAASPDLDESLRTAELVLLAVPVRALPKVAAQLLPFWNPEAILTDTGSVKSPLLNAMRNPKFSEVRFVGGHPIAGGERFGPEAAIPELFQGKRCILTPETHTEVEVSQRVRGLWTALGAEVLEMKASVHDQIFAAVSHLPHLLAYASIDAIVRSDHPGVLAYSGGGLKDFSRIASSSPEMWADIFLNNPTLLLDRVRVFQETLDTLTAAITSGDRDRILKLLHNAKDSRDRWMG
jgi:prephenate dehydrogenase